MAGDITRSTFDPKKGYTSVRMQQGRLQLDADWNEQADIQNHLRRAYVTDMIGAGSGASKVDPFTGNPSDTSFELRAIATAGDPSVATDIALLPGHFYTRGVLCELAPESSFTVRKLDNQRLQISPSLTIDGRRLRAGDWLVLASNTADANPSASQSSDNGESTDNGENALETSSEQSSPSEDPSASAPDDPNDQTEETNGTNPTKPQAPLTGWRIKKIVDQGNREIEVDGALGDMSVTQMRRIVTYTSQSDYILDEESEGFDRLSDQRYFAYLDVWERPVTAVDDPTLREVALNVPDTTTRTKTVWQIKLWPALVKGESDEPDGPVKLKPLPVEEITVPVAIATELPQPWQAFEQAERNRAPRMNACARLCADGTTGSNGRLGNYLYRVEIHQGNDPAIPASSGNDNGDGNQAVTFKWSRNNGSVVSPVKAIEGNVIRISKSSQDAWADSTPGQWLELLTAAQELRGEPGLLVPLRSATDTKLEFDDALIVGGSIPKNVSKVRRWDHTVTDTRQGVLAISSNWVELENGIKVQFDLPDASEAAEFNGDIPSDQAEKKAPIIYRTGDYWLIPARAATNDIEWPSDRADDDVSNQGVSISRPLSQPPHGIEHQYALLAVVDFADEESIPQVYDQRILFPPLLRALDRAGGSIAGDLIIQQDLTVAQTTTTHDLKVTGEFGSTTFRAQRFELSLEPLDQSAPNYGVIKVSQEADANLVEFQSLEKSDFVFRDGKVGIGKAPEQDLDVEGTIDAGRLTQEGQSVALQEDLNSHADDYNNPHEVTAKQINDRDGGNQIVAQINAGEDDQVRIQGRRIDEAIARQSTVDLAINSVGQRLNGHIADDNPHNITAETINGDDGNQIVAEINKKSGDNSATRIDEGLIDAAIARTLALTGLQTQLNGHLEVDNPHEITAATINGSNKNSIVEEINNDLDNLDNPIRIDEKRLDETLVRQIELVSHIDNESGRNPHRVTSEQIDTIDNESQQIVSQINRGPSGKDDWLRIDEQLLPQSIIDHVNNVNSGHSGGRNHHGLTASDINAVSKAGGEINGDLTIENRLTVNQSLGVGASIPENLEQLAKLYVSGNVYVEGLNGQGGKLFARESEATEFVQVSSKTLKEDIVELSRHEVAEALSQLHPVKFHYKTSAPGHVSAGFIAEEVPDLLATTDHHGVKLMDVIAVLTKAVQEHRHVVKQLSAKVKKQDQEIAQLKQTLSNIIPPDS